MTKLKRIIPFGVISFFLSMALFSCIDDNLTDIRWDDEDHWKPDISFPFGSGKVDVNNYFEQYGQPVVIPGDTFPVYYDDSLYNLIEYQITAEETLNYSLSDKINSPRYIEFMNLHFRVWNGYPTECEIQVYFREGSEEVDSLFEEPKIIENAGLDEEGRVEDPREQEFNVDLDQERIEKIYDGDNVLISAGISATRQDLDAVRFYSEYEIKMEAAARLKLNVPPLDLGY